MSIFSQRAMCKTLMVTALILLAGSGCISTTSFSFDVTADMRHYTPPEHAGAAYFAGVCEAIHDVGPGAFMISPGDIDPPARVHQTIADVIGPDYPWYPVVGNHELKDHMGWLRDFNAGGKALPNIVRSGPPGAEETCYAFDYGNVHFAIINEYYDGQSDAATGGDVPETLYKWLADDLSATEKPYIFVVGHEPIIAAPDMATGRVRHQGDSLDAAPKNAHRFWTLLREHEVIAYFCGHTHNTSILKINGVWQIDAGHSRGLGDKGTPSTFMKIYVSPKGIICDVYRSDKPGEKPYELSYTERLR